MLAVAALAAAPASAAAPRYEIDAVLRPGDGLVEGTVVVHPDAAASRLLVLLYPQRFAAPPAGLDERNARWIYPGGFDAGGMTLTSCRTAAGAACAVEPAEGGDAAWIDAGDDPGPVTLGFRTVVPERFGIFGRDGDVTVLGGGWHPLLAARGADGAFDPRRPVDRADYALTLHVAGGWSLLVDGTGPYSCAAAQAAGCRVERSTVAGEPPSVVAAPEWYERSVTSAGVRVRVFSTEAPRSPATYAAAAGVGLDPASVPDLWSIDRIGWMLGVLRDDLRELDEAGLLPPAGQRAGELAVIVAPVRLELTAGVSGAVLVSDQAYELFPIEPFFRFQDDEIARAAVTELVRRSLGALPLAEARWTAELVAAGAVERLAEAAGEARGRAEQWLKYGSFLPVIDQMLFAPQMQFRDLYYGAIEETDSLHDEIWRFDTDLPRGRRLWAKLRDRLGAAAALATLRELLASGGPLEAAASRAAGDALDGFRDTWLGRYPPVNLRLGDWGSEPLADGTWRTTVHLFRDGAHAPREFVTVRTTLDGGAVHDEVWDARAAEGEVSFVAPAPATAVELDPAGRVVQDASLTDNHPRADDVSSLPWRVPVLDKFQLNLDLTTIANSEVDIDFSMRRRYDLHQAFRARFVREARGIGGDLGYSYGFGPPRDLNRPSWYATSWLEVFHHDAGFGGAEGADAPGAPTTLELGAYVGHDDRWFDPDPATGWQALLGASGSFPVDLDPAVAHPWTVRLGGRGFYLWSPALGHTLAFYGGFGLTFGEPVESQYEALGDRMLLAALQPDEALGRAKLYAVAEYRHRFSWDLGGNLFYLAWLRGIEGVLTVGAGTTSDRESMSGLFGRDRVFFEAGYGLRIFLDYAGVQTGLVAFDLFVPFGWTEGQFGLLDKIRRDPADPSTWSRRPALFGIPVSLQLGFLQTF